MKNRIAIALVALVAAVAFAQPDVEELKRPRGLQDRCGKSPFERAPVGESELVGKSPAELHLLRNLVYGYHCLSFNSLYLRDYANYAIGYDEGIARYWPRESKVELNGQEKKNIRIIRDYEERAQASASKNALPLQEGSSIEFSPGKEACYRIKLLGPRDNIVCIYSYDTGEGLLAILGVDWKYFGLNGGDAEYGRPNRMDIFKRSNGVILRFPSLGNYKFDGKKIVEITKELPHVNGRGDR